MAAKNRRSRFEIIFLAMSTPPPVNVQTLHPRVLAYIGDAVYERWVREQGLLAGVVALNDLHRWVTARVNATFQSVLCQTLLPHLSDTEQDWIRRGRNSALTPNKRHHQQVHRQAGGLETLIGALYLDNQQQRLTALLAFIAQSTLFQLSKSTTIEKSIEAGSLTEAIDEPILPID